MTDQPQQRIRITAGLMSLLVGAGLMAVKFYVYHLTGSAAVLSDALESIINVVASSFAIASIIMAAIPPDDSHPYGHGKIEFFSAGFEGALVILAALGIFRIGLRDLLAPHPILELDTGLLLMVAASVVNLILGLGLVRIGRKTRSITLEADGRHVLTDVYTSAGVVVGLVLVRLTDWYWVDGLVACLVGSHILFTGSRLIWTSYQGLMDAADPGVLNQISEVIQAHRRPVWIDIHKLRAWNAGARIHVDLHLILPREMKLEDAHREADDLEAAILAEVPGAESVLVHMDPCGKGNCPVCGQKDCEHREQSFQQTSQWSTMTMTAGVLDEWKGR
ncbi:MAG: cation diffusion facilitator family transporter [Desulfobacterales bacterium]|jgi:cation diffusion facilitator family transporter